MGKRINTKRLAVFSVDVVSIRDGYLLMWFVLSLIL